MNKTRRRKKNAAPVRSFLKPEPVKKVTSPSKIRHGKEQIQKHCDAVDQLMLDADNARIDGDYRESAVLLRKASDTMHLANAEKGRLPADAL